MSTSNTALAAASQDRKARLAQLKSLKRKQAPTDPSDIDSAEALKADEGLASKQTDLFLSGRNFDPTTRNVRLGFETTPIADPTSTLEYKAQTLSLQAKEQAQREEAEREAGKGLDLFSLQPKKPNWDLKRDLMERMREVDVRTENAIARLVRERVEGVKVMAREEGRAVEGGVGEGGKEAPQEVGMEGVELVEAMHLREREEEADREREGRDEDVS